MCSCRKPYRSDPLGRTIPVMDEHKITPGWEFGFQCSCGWIGNTAQEHQTWLLLQAALAQPTT